MAVITDIVVAFKLDLDIRPGNAADPGERDPAMRPGRNRFQIIRNINIIRQGIPAGVQDAEEQPIKYIGCAGFVGVGADIELKQLRVGYGVWQIDGLGQTVVCIDDAAEQGDIAASVRTRIGGDDHRVGGR